MLPFTQQHFIDVFAQFNSTLWPLQMAALAAGVGCIAALLLPAASNAGRMILLALSAMWITTGVVYHGLFFSRINPAAYVFAAAFVLQGLALAWMGCSHKRPRLEAKNDLRSAAAAGLISYSIVLYPLWSFIQGTPYFETPTFGLTPCPLVLFTWGFLLLWRPAPRLLTIIPLLWSVIGGSAAWLLAMPQDILLGISAIAGVWLLWAPGPRLPVERPGAVAAPAPR